MSFESAKEYVEQAMTRGESPEETIAECLDMCYCTKEEADRLRQIFTVQPSREIVPEISVPADSSNPVLQIDWGVEFKQGFNMSPKFTILGLASEQAPLVYFPIDKEIGGENWENMPKLTGNKKDGWSFYQSMKIETAGQFRLRIVMIDAEPGRSDLTYYHSDFRILVADPKETGKRRTLEIEADGNLAASLSNVKGFDHVRVKAGTGAAVDFSGESDADKILQALSNPPVEKEEDDRTTMVPFTIETNSVSGVPYVSVRSSFGFPSRLTMSEPNGCSFRIIGGKRLTFGRDVPEENCHNDIPLHMLPGTEEEVAHAEEFSVLDRLFSREHARLETNKLGLFLWDVRQSGIQDATILDGTPLEKNSEPKLLFPNDETTVEPCTVTFSKMLGMRLTPSYEIFWSADVNRRFPEDLPLKLLNRLYAIDSEKGLTAVSARFEKHLRQKPYADSLKKILSGKTSLPDSPWWNRWFGNAQNVDPRHDRLEYWLVPVFVTIGRSLDNAIRLKNRAWEDVHLRILYVNKALYVESLSPDAAIEYRHLDATGPLKAFRPIPLREGMCLCKDGAELRFE